MVLRLIFSIIVILVLVFFTGFNLDNRCNIWFFFKTFNNVPIFITVFISMAAGILVTLPAAIFRGKKKVNPEEARIRAEKLAKKQAQLAKQQAKIDKARQKAMGESEQGETAVDMVQPVEAEKIENVEEETKSASAKKATRAKAKKTAKSSEPKAEK